MAPMDPVLVDPGPHRGTRHRLRDQCQARGRRVALIRRQRERRRAAEGDCFNSSDDAEEISDVDGVPCTEAHEYEVFALATYEGDGTYPPDSELDAIFTEVCEPEFEPYVGAPYATSEIYGSMISPSEESWGSGDRSFICLLYDPSDPALTESLAGAAR